MMVPETANHRRPTAGESPKDVLAPEEPAGNAFGCSAAQLRLPRADVGAEGRGRFRGKRFSVEGAAPTDEDHGPGE